MILKLLLKLQAEIKAAKSGTSAPVVSIPAPSTAPDFQAIDDHFGGKSYVVGYEPSQADIDLLELLKSHQFDQWPSILRWKIHIANLIDEGLLVPQKTKNQRNLSDIFKLVS